MTEDQRKQYQAAYLKATTPWQGGKFEHFDAAGWEQHLREVKEAQKVHNTPF